MSFGLIEGLVIVGSIAIIVLLVWFVVHLVKKFRSGSSYR